MKVIGIPGIHSRGKDSTIRVLVELDKLGHRILPLVLGNRNILNARWKTKRDVDEIVKFSEPGDILVAHSRGCILAGHAAQRVEYSHIFVLAPAMSKNWEWFNPRRVTCFHSKGDWVVKLGSRLLFHPFGLAGVVGYTQHGVQNIGVSSDHDDYFQPPLLNNVVDSIRSAYQSQRLRESAESWEE